MQQLSRPFHLHLHEIIYMNNPEIISRTENRPAAMIRTFFVYAGVCRNHICSICGAVSATSAANANFPA